MNRYKITIRTVSPLCLSSGKADVNVDAEIVHDEYGMPYFPGKRLKGLLYESALEVSEMAALCNVPFMTKQTVEELFHHTISSSVQLIIPNLYLPDYEKMIQDWKSIQTVFSSIVRPADVLDYYTSLRFQTAIDKKTGVAMEHSLRNTRVLHSGIIFTGYIGLDGEEDRHLQALALAVQNLRRAGLHRNRGFGQIECRIEHQDDLIRQALHKGGRK